jgi:hypothetical protein
MYEAVHYILKTSTHDIKNDVKNFNWTVSCEATVYGMTNKTDIYFISSIRYNCVIITLQTVVL